MLQCSLQLQWELYQTKMIIYEADDMLAGMAEATNIDTLWLVSDILL